jgi:hypothetical protein
MPRNGCWLFLLFFAERELFALGEFLSSSLQPIITTRGDRDFARYGNSQKEQTALLYVAAISLSQRYPACMVGYRSHFNAGTQMSAGTNAKGNCNLHARVTNTVFMRTL